MKNKTIYYRVFMDWSHLFPILGKFTDLKTLKGAKRRLYKQYPTARAYEAEFEPFGDY